MAYYEGEISPMCWGGNNNGGFGNGWEGLIGLALVAGLFDNGNGGGIFGNRGGNNGGCCTAGLATQADLANGFAQNTLQRGIDDIILGQATMQNFVNQGFAGVNATVTNGFANLNTALCSLGYNIQGGFNDISHQISDCCCTTQRAIDSVKYENAKNTCDIIRAGQDNTRAILDYLTGEKISSLQAENAGLKAQISNDRQSAYIIDALAPKCPQASYLVQAPTKINFPVDCCGNFTGFNNGCGCN